MRNALKWIFLTILAVLTAPTILFVWLIFYDRTVKIRYDENHPDYERFASDFKRLRALETTRANDPNWSIDFSTLGSGRWQTACLLGGYEDPLTLAKRSGWQIAEVDRARFASPQGLRFTIVEENEVMIAYVDDLNNVEFIHFKEGIGSIGQHLVTCIEKPITRIDLTPLRGQQGY